MAAAARLGPLRMLPCLTSSLPLRHQLVVNMAHCPSNFGHRLGFARAAAAAPCRMLWSAALAWVGLSGNWLQGFVWLSGSRPI
jgi:hypothetical protein